MLRVGLTGGIAAGKSLVAARFADLGAVLIDADLLAREVVAPGTPGLAAVRAAFGAGVLGPDGGLDRAALAEQVFADPAARRRLNAIVHPLVGARTEQLFAAVPPDAVVVHDVPLLVENGLAPSYHLVVVVTAPEAVRVRRLVASRGFTAEQARARIASQADDAERRRAADVLLDSDRPRPAVLAEVDRLWAERVSVFRDNLLAGRCASPAAPRLVEPDPTWPEQFDRVAARLGHLLGRAVGRIDHVGSTAVPGLAAKDILDVQVTVPSLAAAERAAPALAAGGFPAVTGITSDTPQPDGCDPAPWAKRFHASADPGRPVHLHLRPAGSPAARLALLFRDWLRADQAARAAYEREKRRLAAAHPTSRAAYAAAKEPWFAAALPEAEAWARQTGWRPPV